MVKKITILFTGIGVALLFAEGIARIAGYQPYDYRSREEIMELFRKENRNEILFIPDSLTGYKLSAGSYLFPFPDGSSFKAVHDSDGHRNSAPPGGG